MSAGALSVDPVVRLDGVSVRFRVPHEPVGSFKEYAIRRIQRRVTWRDFWALRNVDLSIHGGEVFGVVGRNGAGKSTLLRVVAAVLRPTCGRVRVVGWPVCPLLELGAGFHPELTGRENVYLNGTLLGHSRREVEAVFDSIVEFSELAEFIDAPLRTYSSGMAARLGFAAATAWHPSVLLVDELLSVGDEAFRLKCEARIDRFRQDGATVIVVSHSLGEVEAVCQRAVWLEHGEVRALGPAGDVVRAYHDSFKT